jgi:hypothetical protein
MGAGLKWLRLWPKGREWRNGLDSDSSGLDSNGSDQAAKVAPDSCTSDWGVIVGGEGMSWIQIDENRAEK